MTVPLINYLAIKSAITSHSSLVKFSARISMIELETQTTTGYQIP